MYSKSAESSRRDQLADALPLAIGLDRERLIEEGEGR